MLVEPTLWTVWGIGNMASFRIGKDDLFGVVFYSSVYPHWTSVDWPRNKGVILQIGYALIFLLTFVYCTGQAIVWTSLPL